MGLIMLAGQLLGGVTGWVHTIQGELAGDYVTSQYVGALGAVPYQPGFAGQGAAAWRRAERSARTTRHLADSVGAESHAMT